MVIVKLVPILLENLELYGTIWVFAGASFIGLLFTIFVVRETKGTNLDLLEETPNKERVC